MPDLRGRRARARFALDGDKGANERRWNRAGRLIVITTPSTSGPLQLWLFALCQIPSFNHNRVKSSDDVDDTALAYFW